MLRNSGGMEVRITNYGATVVSIYVRDRDDVYDDVVLGFDSLDGYRTHTWYAGATVGRYAGRISAARFNLAGREHRLFANDGANHLHGGQRGFDRVVWDAQHFAGPASRVVRLRYLSPDGEEGYPGTIDALTTYTLTDDDELIIDYFATTDRATPISLTQHSYFNLAGAGNGNVLDHEIMIAADYYLPVNRTLIPTGEILDVKGTPFDFREPASIGSRINAAHDQLSIARGYDHDFVLRGSERLAARVQEPKTGRVLEVSTSQPVLHFYSGSYSGVAPAGKNGVQYPARAGFALEAQQYGDAPNQARFPSAILQPGNEYRARTTYRFRAMAAR